MNRTQMIKRAYVRGLAARGIYRARLRQKQAAGGLKDYAISGGIGAAGGGALGSLIGALVQYARGKNVLQGALAGGGIGGGLGLLGGLGYQALKGRNATVDGLPASVRGMKKFLRKNYGDYGADADRIAQQAVDIVKSRGEEIMPPNLDGLSYQTPQTQRAIMRQIYGDIDDSTADMLIRNTLYGVPSTDTLDNYEAKDMRNSRAQNKGSSNKYEDRRAKNNKRFKRTEGSPEWQEAHYYKPPTTSSGRSQSYEDEVKDQLRAQDDLIKREQSQRDQKIKDSEWARRVANDIGSKIAQGITITKEERDAYDEARRLYKKVMGYDL